MDLKHPTTKIPNPENETPPHHHHSKSITKLSSSSFSNGNTHHYHPPPHTAAVYKECLKNHAAGIGGHALDGCGEFMPSTSSLTCAACGCHRNFHRREPTTTIVTRTTHLIDFHRPSPSPPSPSPPPAANLLLSLTTAADQNHAVATPGTPVAIKISGRNKRFRTKFSQEQKEKMMGFAEKIGWKMQRIDDKMIMDFCNSIGIRRGVFKVWMHNNKNTFGNNKKDTTTTAITTTAITTVTAAVAGDLVRSNDSSSHDQETASGGDVHLQDSTNGSSSSS